MTTREQVEAEAEAFVNELYPNARENASFLVEMFVAGRTVTAEQVEAAAAMLWVVCSVRDCRAWVQLTDAMQETFRDDARAAFRAAGFYVMEAPHEHQSD